MENQASLRILSSRRARVLVRIAGVNINAELYCVWESDICHEEFNSTVARYDADNRVEVER